MKNYVMLPALMLVMTLGLAACEEGPAESAGKKIDSTLTDVGNKLEDTCEKAKENAGAEDTDC